MDFLLKELIGLVKRKFNIYIGCGSLDTKMAARRQIQRYSLRRVYIRQDLKSHIRWRYVVEPRHSSGKS